MNRSVKFEAVVVVANRCEIARRGVSSVRATGPKAIEVFHRADAGSPAERETDIAVEITGATPVAANLDSAQVLAIAKSHAPCAIHPGYGFLSESADFLRAGQTAEVAFVGPAADVIDLVDDKVRARAFVQNAGFPVAPSANEDDDPATFAQRAFAVGFPLFITSARAASSATSVTAGPTSSALSKTRAISMADDKLSQFERDGHAVSEDQVAAIRAPIVEDYSWQSSALYSTSRLWDDGILDPVISRNALGMSISASPNTPNTPIAEPSYGVSRM